MHHDSSEIGSETMITSNPARLVLPLVLALIPLLGCGSEAPPSGGEVGGGMSTSGSASASGGSSRSAASSGGPASSAGGGGQWSDAGPSAQIVCTTQGQRRTATPTENAQYCVCEPVSRTEGTQTTTWLVWSCYGASPRTPTPSPTACSFIDTNPGSGGSCWANWSSCSNGENYSLTCIDRDCRCMVDGRSTTVLVEPRDSCPPDKATLNSLCGWNVR